MSRHNLLSVTPNHTHARTSYTYAYAHDTAQSVHRARIARRSTCAYAVLLVVSIRNTDHSITARAASAASRRRD